MFQRNQQKFSETPFRSASDRGLTDLSRIPGPEIQSPPEEITPPPEEYSPGRDPVYRYETRDGFLMKKGKLLCLLCLTVLMAAAIRNLPERDQMPPTQETEAVIPETALQKETETVTTQETETQILPSTEAVTAPAVRPTVPATEAKETESESDTAPVESETAAKKKPAESSAQPAAAAQSLPAETQAQSTSGPEGLPQFVDDGVKDPDISDGPNDPASDNKPKKVPSSDNDPYGKLDTGNEGYAQGDDPFLDDEEETWEEEPDDEEGITDGPGPVNDPTIWVSPGESLPPGESIYYDWNNNNGESFYYDWNNNNGESFTLPGMN